LLAIEQDWERKREGLKVRRAPLAAKYEENPGDLQLAVKLMKIDDEIAECTAFMTRERRLNPATGG
jgi:hypothetical protein